DRGPASTPAPAGAGGGPPGAAPPFGEHGRPAGAGGGTQRPGAAPLGPPLRRPRSGRVLGGVAAGLAQNLGAKVSAVRWAFAAFGLVGVGVVFYVWLWLTVPSGDPSRPPPALARLGP
ncbi:MAG: PspC domain-containing protein, partial [Bifidobacteriaceae bacterium]|nr:PspC domain-containing protein [Bifidobacteriaceae bacterium]